MMGDTFEIGGCAEGTLFREGMAYVGLLPKVSLSIEEVHRVGGSGVLEVVVPEDVGGCGGGGGGGEGGTGERGGVGPYLLLQLYLQVTPKTRQ